MEDLFFICLNIFFLLHIPSEAALATFKNIWTVTLFSNTKNNSTSSAVKTPSIDLCLEYQKSSAGGIWNISEKNDSLSPADLETALHYYKDLLGGLSDLQPSTICVSSKAKEKKNLSSLCNVSIHLISRVFLSPEFTEVHWNTSPTVMQQHQNFTALVETDAWTAFGVKI